MKIKFNSIKINNFLSLGDVELTLSGRGYSLLKGINQNPSDNAKSNGSGKSALFDAIVWCLTGKTIRGISSNIVNINSIEGCKVELNFTVNNNSYLIIRSREHKELGTNLKIYINGQDKSGKGIRDTEKLLEQYLPELTPSLLGSVIILGQGMPQRFTNNTPSGRKEVLESLSKSDFMIEDIKDRLSQRYSSLSSSLRKIEDELLLLKGRKDTYSKMLKSLKDNLNNFPDEGVLKKEVDSLNSNVEDISLQKSNVSKKLEYVQSEIDKNKSLEYNLKQKILDSQTNINNIFENDINSLNAQIASINTSIGNLIKEIKELDSVLDVCPTCGQKLNNVHKIDTSDKKKYLKTLEEEKSLLGNELAQKKKEKEEFLFKEISQLNFALQDLENSIKEEESEINSLKLNLSSLSGEEEKIRHYLLTKKAELESLSLNKESLLSQISTIENDTLDMDSSILYNDKERKVLSDRLDILNKMLTLAKRDFRGYLLSNVINFINNRAKEYCEDIFSTRNISFELDKNDILISYDGKPYENLSGGEKQRIDIIIQLSIRDMLCQLSNFSSNMLVLDEIFDNLDSLSCKKVVDLISNKLSDVESIFIITHHTDIPISADSTITVVKNEKGISYLK